MPIATPSSALLVAALCAAAPALAQTGTALKITNATNQSVPVMITLGSGAGIATLNQLPAAWNIVPYAGGKNMQGTFFLSANSSVVFNSGSQSFSGNIAFGPTFSARGCGNAAAGACYPNATNLAEFSLNLPGETVDISNVNGVNANIAVAFTGQTSQNPWNNGTWQGANQNVTGIAYLPISQAGSGVYGWQATNCINVVPPIPNPIAGCPAPIAAPSSAVVQSNAQCNIQRAAGAPTGGQVEVTFSGYVAGSGPQPGCVVALTVAPTTGSQNGGTTVTLMGSGLDQVASVTFQGAAATITSQSVTSLTLTTPACNFCTGAQPWNSNIQLNLQQGAPVILPMPYVYTSN